MWDSPWQGGLPRGSEQGSRFGFGNQKLYFEETADTSELNPQNSHSEIVLKLCKLAKNQITTHENQITHPTSE